MVETLHISGEKANPCFNICSSIYKTKTKESCFQLSKMIECTGHNGAQLEDWSSIQSAIAISFGQYLSIIIIIIIIAIKNPLFQRFNS